MTAGVVKRFQHSFSFNIDSSLFPCVSTQLVGGGGGGGRQTVSTLLFNKIEQILKEMLLLKIGSKCLDLKGHFVLDVKIGRASN